MWPISPSLSLLPFFLSFLSHLNDFCHISQGLHTPSSLPGKFCTFRPFPQSAALNIKKIFAVMIHLRILRLPWIIWVSPKCNHLYLLKWQTEGDFFLKEEEKMTVGSQVRGHSDTATSLETPEVGRGKGWILPRAIRGSLVWPIIWFWPSDMNFRLLNY